KSENFSFEWDELRGVLSFVRGTILFKAHTAVTREGTHETTLAKFLSQYGTLFGPDQIMRYLRLARNKRDDIGMTHLMYQHFMIDSEHPKRKCPIEVYGSKLAAHFSRDGDLVEIQSSCYPSLLVTNEIKVTTSELQKQLLKDLNGMNAFRLLRNEMKKRNEKLFPLMQQPRIVVYPWKGKQIFAWATYGYGKFSREPDIRESEP